MDASDGVLHTSPMRNRKPLVAAFFIPIMVGCIGISNIARNPRFESFHTVDILQLIASGMCFGAALSALLIMVVRGQRTP